MTSLVAGVIERLRKLEDIVRLIEKGAAMVDDVIAEIQATIERRVREQLARHFRVDPNIEPRKVVDIQIEQERERLDRMAEKFENDGKDNLAEFVRVLADEWLPEFSQELKRR